MVLWQKLLARKKWEQELDEELRFHVERQTAENVAAGLPPQEARRRAVLQLGAAEGWKEYCREQRRGFWLETTWTDVRYGFRMLAKNWRLTSLAILSLGVAMAVCVVGVSVFNTALLRPPAAADPSRLVTIYTRSPSGAFEDVSYPDYEYYRTNNQVFSGVAAFPNSISKFNMSFGKRDEAGTINAISDNYFTVMGIQPVLGELFIRGDDDKKIPAAVLSYSCWKRWGADPQIIGKTMTVRRHTLTIVGVAAKSFPGTVFGFGTDVFITLATAADIFQDPGSLTDRAERGLLLVARLRPNATRQQARAEIGSLSQRLAADFPEADKNRAAVLTNTSVLPPDARSTAELISGVLVAIVLLVLLIACANVANLLLGLAAGRKQEVLIRVALGATRARLVRQLLTESTLLCAASGIVGFLAASVPLRKLSDFNASLPVMGAFEFAANLRADGMVVAMTFGLIVIAGLAVGLAPALHSSKPNLAGAMSGEIAVGGTRKGILRNLLVGIQVAVCTLVMVGVGLCLRSLHNLREVNPGFSARNLAAVTVDLQESGFSEAQGRKFYDDFAGGIPTVRSRIILPGPGASAGRERLDTDEVHFEGKANENQQPVEIAFTVVDGNYFATLGIPLLAGRTFDSSDSEKSPEVVVMNHKLAETYWPGETRWESACASKRRRMATVAGVVGDGKYSDLDEPTVLTVLRPCPALPNRYRFNHPDRGDPRQWLEPLAQIVRKLGAQSVLPPVTFDEWMRFTLFLPTLTLEVVSGLGALALLLAAVGFTARFFIPSARGKRKSESAWR